MPSEKPSRPELRQVTDVRTMRAITHPVRIALIEALSLEGAMTATEAGEAIGESPTTCSFHLRQLAKYGFVEEAGGGKGRARPWRMTSIGMSISSAAGDPQARVAASALSRLLQERHLARLQTWLETRSLYPQEWQKAAGQNESVIYLTAAELEELEEELVAILLPRYRERLTDPSLRPQGSLPVEILTFSYPIRFPDEG
ncbi:MAG: winged helix-turn-helix domain-containing protein [Acidimicrobiales bacterium]